MEAAEKVVAFVAYPEVTPLDLVGPLSVFNSLPGYRAVVVGERTEPMQTSARSGMEAPIKLVPTRTFDDVPQPHILIVPGAGRGMLLAMANPAILAYVRAVSECAEVVGSVCTGALILAAAGLLDGRRATTHWAYAYYLERLGAQYVQRRWVEDGKFITAAGVSAGIDMGLYLAGRLTDEATARSVQLGMEYDPQPPFGAIDWREVDREYLQPHRISEAQREETRAALAGRPDLFEKLMS